MNSKNMEYFKINGIMLFGSGYKKKRYELIEKINEVYEKRNEIMFAFLYEDFEEHFNKVNNTDLINKIDNFILEMIAMNISTFVIVNFESTSTAVELIMANSLKNKNKFFYIHQLGMDPNEKQKSKEDLFKRSVFEDKKNNQVGFVANDFFKSILDFENSYDNSKNNKQKIFTNNNLFYTLESENNLNNKVFKEKIRRYLYNKDKDSFLNSSLSNKKSFIIKHKIWKRYLVTKQNLKTFNKHLTFEEFKLILKCFLDFINYKYDGNKKRVNWSGFVNGFVNRKISFGKMYSIKYIKRNNKRRKIYYLQHKEKIDVDNKKYKKMKRKIDDSYEAIKCLHNEIIKKYNDDLNLFSYIPKHTTNWLDLYGTNSGTLCSALLLKRSQNNFILKIDVKDFFNSMNHNVFSKIISLDIFKSIFKSEEDYNEFIKKIKFTIQVHKEININQNLNSKYKSNLGFHQGVKSSAYISNLFLLPLDLLFSKKYTNIMSNDLLKNFITNNRFNYFSNLFKLISIKTNSLTYSRYSDDLIISSNNEGDLKIAYKCIKAFMKEIFKLELNLDKSKIIDLKQKEHFKIFDFNYIYGNSKNHQEGANYLTHTRKTSKLLKNLTLNSENLNESESAMLRYLSYCNMILQKERMQEILNDSNFSHSYSREIYDFFNSIFENKKSELKEDEFIVSDSFKIRLFVKINDFNEKIAIEFRKFTNEDSYKFSIYVANKNNEYIYFDDKQLIERCEYNVSKINKMKLHVFEGNKINEDFTMRRVISNEFNISENQICDGNIYNYLVQLISKLKWNDFFEKNYYTFSDKAICYFNSNDKIKNKVDYIKLFKNGNFDFKKNDKI